MLLLFGSVTTDLIHAQVRVRAVRKTDGARCTCQLFHHDAMGEIAEPGTAELRFDGDSEHAELTEFRPQPARKLVRPIDLGRMRRDLALCKTRNRIAQRIDVRAETEIEQWEVR